MENTSAEDIAADAAASAAVAAKAVSQAAEAAAEAAAPVKVLPLSKLEPEVINESVKPPAHLMTYDDDASFGKDAPSLATLKYHKGEPVTIGNGKPTVVFFWASFAEGDYPVIVAISQLARRNPNVQVVGVSADTNEVNVTKFIGKLGHSFPEINVKLLEAEFAIAFDPEKTVRTAYQKVASLTTIGASAIFLVDAAGKIVWREQFSQSHTLDKGQFKAQLKRLLEGQPLLKNGDKPKDDDDEEEMDLGGDDDLGLI